MRLSQSLITALGSTMVLFGLTVSLTIYLFGNHVRGLRSAGRSTIVATRDAAWALVDAARKEAGLDVRELMKGARELLCLSEAEWFDVKVTSDWNGAVQAQMEAATEGQSRFELTTRYIMPIHEGVTEIARLSLLHATVRLYLERVTRTLYQFVLIFLVSVIVQVLPASVFDDHLRLGLAAGALTLAITNVIFILSLVTHALYFETDEEFVSTRGESSRSTRAAA